MGRSILPWKPHLGPIKHGPVYPLMLLMHAGAIGALVSRDLFNFFVYMEIALAATFILVAFSQEVGSKEAAYRYLIFSVMSSFFFLLALGIIYVNTGFLNIGLIQENIILNRETEFALWIMVVSLFVKAGIFPLHLWSPHVHAKSHVPVVALVSGIMVTLPMYRLILLVTYFPDGISSTLLMIFAFSAIFFGIIAAFLEYDVFRMLAYCTVTNMGFVLLGAALLNEEAALNHLFVHMLLKSALFLSLGTIIYAKGSRDMRNLNYRDKPFMALSVLFLSFSLCMVFPLLGSHTLGTIYNELSGFWKMVFSAASFGVLLYYMKLNHNLFRPGGSKVKQPVLLHMVPLFMFILLIMYTLLLYTQPVVIGFILLPAAALIYAVLHKMKLMAYSWNPFFQEQGHLGKEINMYTTLVVMTVLVFLFQWF